MRQTTKTYFNVAWALALIAGILYSITIVGLIFGIPLFIASAKLKKAHEMDDEELIKNRSNLLGWGIFLAIMLSPTIIGLIVILCFVLMVNNFIKDLEQGNTEKTEKSFEQTVADTGKDVGNTIKENAIDTWEGFKRTFGIKTSLQKQKEQLAELEKLKEEGVITEEEYQAKRKQILKID